MSDLYYDADLINYCEELEERLTKYKRAFEILKKHMEIYQDISLDGTSIFQYIFLKGTYDSSKRIEKEEYEMLEELLSD